MTPTSLAFLKPSAASTLLASTVKETLKTNIRDRIDTVRKI